jgi:exopolyphosphatase/guanosine-5'-triphosphate,3'-diphosphate pyrophosphatase
MHDTLAAIDVGTNSARLTLARPRPDGSLAIVCERRDAVRTGEGVFGRGSIAPVAMERLLTVLARYGAICRAFDAEVRAVATSAVREADNRHTVLARARREAGVELEVLSGREEARLICAGVLGEQPAHARSLILDVGGGSTEIISACGERPVAMWSVALGAVRLTERLGKRARADELDLLRAHARAIIADALPRDIAGPSHAVLGSSGTIRAIVGFAAPTGTARLTRGQLAAAVVDIAAMTADERCARFGADRADVVTAGAVALGGDRRAREPPGDRRRARRPGRRRARRDDARARSVAAAPAPQPAEVRLAAGR